MTQAINGSKTEAKASQEVEKKVQEIQEGSAKIQLSGEHVFYNNAQVVNRDISILVLNWFAKQIQEDIKQGILKPNQNAKKGSLIEGRRPDDIGEGLYIFEGLSASGLRSIRYANEIPGVARVVANDYEQNSVEAIQKNIEYNNAQDKVIASHNDARIAMLQNPKVFDVVDIDPYGTPSQFIDGGVQAVRDGGLLMVTATDMAVLCGNNSEACFNKYGSYPLHKPYCHEQALRILLYSIEVAANKYKRHIKPILSLSIDFYVRVFVRVYTSPQNIKDTPIKLSYVWQSCACEAFYFQTLADRHIKNNQAKYVPARGPPMPQECEFTGSKFQMGGPIWTYPIHDIEAVGSLLQDLENNEQKYQASLKLQGLLNCVLDELVDVPLYFNLHGIAGTFKVQPPKMEVVKSAIIHGGYQVSGSHANPLAVKTNAPWPFIFDIMRSWNEQHPRKQKPQNSPLSRLLNQPITHEINFNLVRDPYANKQKQLKQKAKARYIINPDNWGPMKANNLMYNYKKKRGVKNYDGILENEQLQKVKKVSDKDKYNLDDDAIIEKFDNTDDKNG